MCGIVEKVTCRPGRLELHISMPGNGSRRVFADHTMLDLFGFGDASSLAERVVFFTRPDEGGWVRLLPVQRRVDYADGSTAAGWLHPAGAVTDDQVCPCGSAEPYSACHGATIPAADPEQHLDRELPSAPRTEPELLLVQHARALRPVSGCPEGFRVGHRL